MSAGSRRRHLAATATDVRIVAEGLAALERQWSDMAAGLRAASTENDRTTGSTTVTDENGDTMPAVSDPTGEAATSDSKARAAERRFDRLAESLARTAAGLEAIVREWTVTKPASVAELHKLERDADPGCEIVARCRRADGSAYWEPEHVTSTVSGTLDREYRLGRWAWEFVRRNGRLPTLDETGQHLDGRRVRAEAS